MFKFNCKCLSLFVLLTMVLIPVVMQPVYAASTLYCSQTFDYIEAGAKSESFINDESTYGGTSAKYEKQTSTDVTPLTPTIINTNGNGYLSINASTWYKSNWYKQPAANTYMVFEIKVKTPAATDANALNLILYGTDALDNYMYLKVARNSINLGAIKTGSGESTTTPIFSNLTADTWHYLRAYIDLTNNTKNITLTIGTEYDKPVKKAIFSSLLTDLSNTPKGMRVNPNALADKTMYIDDIKAYSIEKPLLSDVLIEGVESSRSPFDPVAQSYEFSSLLSSFRIKPVYYGATTTVTVNGTDVTSGAWSEVFDISFSETENITIVATPLGGEPVTYNINVSRGREFIIDNGDKGYSEGAGGTWAPSTSLQGYKDKNTRSNSSDLSNCSWKPNTDNLVVSGLTEVYFYNVAHSSNVTKPASVTVSHNGKTDVILVNHNTTAGNTAGLVYLGTFDFAGTSDEGVTLRKSEAEAGKTIRSDAVKFVVPTFGAMAEYKKVDGEIVTDITRTGLVAGDVKCDITLVNNTDEIQDVCIVTALYNKTTGVLSYIKIKDDSLNKSETKTVSNQAINVPNNADYKMKVFVLNELGKMVPLATLSDFNIK